MRIDADWIEPDSGGAEERACLARLSIWADKQGAPICLTEAHKVFTGTIEPSLNVCACTLGEWLAWNWWRLRWEPRREGLAWGMAHRMSTIGGGFVWPNLTLWSDGERIVLLPQSNGSGDSTDSASFLGKPPVILPAGDFEAGVDDFMGRLMSRLHDGKLTETNVQRLWTDVLAERADPDSAHWRRLEARLGYDPDEADPAFIESLLAEAKALGQDALDELAAGYNPGKVIPSADAFGQMARQDGYETRPAEGVAPLQIPERSPGTEPAWRQGVEAARHLREQERLGSGAINDQKLCAMAAVDPNILSEQAHVVRDLSFLLRDDDQPQERMALRSKWTVGRRFELARLLGDRLTLSPGQGEERLAPALGSYTYRQQRQRAFAGEFLCPYQALQDLMDGDTSPDAIEKAAEHFNVSERVITTHLKNHGQMDRDEFEDFTLAA